MRLCGRNRSETVAETSRGTCACDNMCRNVVLMLLGSGGEQVETPSDTVDSFLALRHLALVLRQFQRGVSNNASCSFDRRQDGHAV